VAIHHIRDGFGPRRLVQLIVLGEDGEFLSYYPEFKEQFDQIRNNYEHLLTELDLNWYNVNKIVGENATQKEFAAEALKTKFPAYLFSKRKGEIKTAKEFLANMAIDKLTNILE